jgi:hypothetical protein
MNAYERNIFRFDARRDLGKVGVRRVFPFFDFDGDKNQFAPSSWDHDICGANESDKIGFMRSREEFWRKDVRCMVVGEVGTAEYRRPLFVSAIRDTVGCAWAVAYVSGRQSIREGGVNYLIVGSLPKYEQIASHLPPLDVSRREMSSCRALLWRSWWRTDMVGPQPAM